jgi:hypothetical protein
MLTLTSPTSGGRSVGTVRSRTQATEFSSRKPHTESFLCETFFVSQFHWAELSNAPAAISTCMWQVYALLFGGHVGCIAWGFRVIARRIPRYCNEILQDKLLRNSHLFIYHYYPLKGITGTPCSWGIYIWKPSPPGWGSLRWDSKVLLRVLSDTDHWVTTLQIANPSSRQRRRPIDTRSQISDGNIPTGGNIWSQGPQGYSISRHTDWPSVVK